MSALQAHRCHVVVVGASVAGVRAAEELRRAGHEGRISLVGDEVHAPYDRPPLSKQLLDGRRGPDDILLGGRDGLESLDLELRLGSRAVDVTEDRVLLSDGDDVAYDRLIVATGVAARTLGGPPPSSGPVHVLRTLDDALRLRTALVSARHLLVVGAGFIGAEVAAVARARGIEVTMVESLDAPFARALGPTVGAAVADLHRDHGVHLLSGTPITNLHAGDDEVRVSLGDGTTLQADLAVVGIGTVPNVNWLSGSGLSLGPGVGCDARGRVVGRDGWWAVGDVAAWDNPLYGDRRRVEHWTSATEQARVVAHELLGRSAGGTGHQVPYFWSDQYETKIQLVGRPDLADRVLTTVPPDKPHQFLARYFRDRRLVAAVTFGAPALLARHRRLVSEMAHEDVVSHQLPTPA